MLNPHYHFSIYEYQVLYLYSTIQLKWLINVYLCAIPAINMTACYMFIIYLQHMLFFR